MGKKTKKKRKIDVVEKKREKILKMIKEKNEGSILQEPFKPKINLDAVKEEKILVKKHLDRITKSEQEEKMKNQTLRQKRQTLLDKLQKSNGQNGTKNDEIRKEIYQIAVQKKLQEQQEER